MVTSIKLGSKFECRLPEFAQVKRLSAHLRNRPDEKFPGSDPIMVPAISSVDKLNQASPYSLHRSPRGRKFGGVGAEFGVDSLFVVLEDWGSSPCGDGFVFCFSLFFFFGLVLRGWMGGGFWWRCYGFLGEGEEWWIHSAAYWQMFTRALISNATPSTSNIQPFTWSTSHYALPACAATTKPPYKSFHLQFYIFQTRHPFTTKWGQPPGCRKAESGGGRGGFTFCCFGLLVRGVGWERGARGCIRDAFVAFAAGAM